MSDSRNTGWTGQRSFTAGNSRLNAIEFLVRTMTGGMATSMPAQVVAVHGGSLPAPPTVDIQPMVAQVDGQGNATPHGVVFNVPVFRYQAGSSAVVLDPVAGDIGVAVFSHRDISAVKNTRAPANPGSFRRFDYADAMFFGAILGDEVTRYIRFRSDGGIDLVDSFANSIVMDAAGVTINGVLIPRGGISFNAKTHTHDQANDSGGDIEQPTDAPNNGS